MAEQGMNPEEEPIRFTDKRKIDPETGQARNSEPGQSAEDSAAGQGRAGAPQGADGDALHQAEQILDEAAAGSDGKEASAQGDSDASAELLKDLQRVQAEFTNYRRRVQRDKDQARETGINTTMSNLIPVLDDVDAARQAGDLTDGPFAAIANKLDTVLGQMGLERINEAGVEFDPAIHDAVLRQPVPGVPADHVGQVLRGGFRRGDRVLRAAQVMVSTGE